MCIAACEPEAAGTAAGTAAGESDSRIRELARLRAVTIQAKVAGSHYEDTVPAEEPQPHLSSVQLSKTPRPGTSFYVDASTASSTSSTHTATTRLPATARAHTSIARVSTARPARTALAATARAARAATALRTGSPATAAAALAVSSLHATSDRLIFNALAKTLCEYVLFAEGDVRKAMEVVGRAQKESSVDWWWNFSAAKCYLMLGLKINAEECLRLAFKQNKHICTYLRLVSMYVGLNQPLAALEMCKSGLAVFPDDVSLRLEQARFHDAMGNSSLAVKEYRQIALHNANNMEAVASIAHYNFYNHQPEIALRYYRRLLVTCPASLELYNNIGLCCLSCNQWDLVMTCFRHALFLATTPDTKAEVWFNLAHVSLTTGDVVLATRCLRASLSAQSEHEPAARSLAALNAASAQALHLH